MSPMCPVMILKKALNLKQGMCSKEGTSILMSSPQKCGGFLVVMLGRDFVYLIHGDKLHRWVQVWLIQNVNSIHYTHII
jgi:hypothetical protein